MIENIRQSHFVKSTFQHPFLNTISLVTFLNVDVSVNRIQYYNADD